jgi:outer membrane receptor protein involved in Fe transport
MFMIFQPKYRSVVLLSFMSSAVFIPQAQAQNPTSASTGGVPDIIVTAQKRAQSINDVGLTITALTSDALDRQGVQSMQDIARMVPGLNYADTDHGTPIFTLRGVGFSDNSLSGYPTTSVYVDEVPLPFAVMAAHANLDLERLEVLKGPQGTLFGQNSTGGAINYIAAKPTDQVAAGVDVTVGRFGQGEANGYVSGPLSDTLGMRLSGQYGYGDGWQKSYTSDDTNGKRNYLNGRLLTVWNPTSALKIQLNLNGWRDRSDPLAPQLAAINPLFDGADFPPPFTMPGLSLVDPRAATYAFAPDKPRAADWNAGFGRPRGERWQYQGGLRGDLDVTDNIVLTSITSFIKFHTDQTFDLDGTDLEIYGFHIRGNIKAFTQELRLAGGEGTAFYWVLGANYERSRTYEDQFSFYDDSTLRTALGNGPADEEALSKKRNYAFFASGDYEVVPGVTLKAGGRYTNSRQTMDQCFHDSGDGTINAAVAGIYAGFHPGVPFPAAIGDCTTLDPVTFEPSRFLDTLKEHNFSWRGGVDYKVNRNLLLYGTVAKGYKAGGWPTTGALLLTSYAAVKQESLLDYEAGFKAQLLDRKLSLNGAAFWYEYRDKQLLGRYLDLIFGPLPILTNIPKSRITGLELELNAAPIEGLQLSGGVTYLDAKVTEFVGVNAGGALADFAGTPIPFTSKWQYIASVDYILPTDSGIRPFFGATVTGRSSMTAIVGSASGARMKAGFRSIAPLAELYNLPSYTMLDLRAGIQAPDGDWRFTVWGRNVTNEYSATNVLIANDVIARYAGQPATYGVTFSHKFGG